MDSSHGVGNRFPHLTAQPSFYANKGKAASRIFPGYKNVVFVINQSRWGKIKSSVKGLFNGAHLRNLRYRKAMVAEARKIGMIKDGKYTPQLAVLKTMLSGRAKLYARLYLKMNSRGREVYDETVKVIADTIKEHSGGAELSGKDRLKILTHIRGLDSMFGYFESPDITSFNRRFPVESNEPRTLGHSESDSTPYGESMRN